MDAAERLFGERGIDGVSLREIAVHAGQRNNSAVSYHFKDKAGLVTALLEDRVSKAERIRQAHVDRVADLDALDAIDLLRMLWEPLLQVDGGGHHFVRFFLTYQQSPSQAYPSHAAPERYPASVRLRQALLAKFPHLSRAAFEYRLALLAMMTWAAMAWDDNSATVPQARRGAPFSLETPLALAIGALNAPA